MSSRAFLVRLKDRAVAHYALVRAQPEAKTIGLLGEAADTCRS